MIEVTCDHCGKRRATAFVGGELLTPGWLMHAAHSGDPEMRIRQLCSKACIDAVYSSFERRVL